MSSLTIAPDLISTFSQRLSEYAQKASHPQLYFKFHERQHIAGDTAYFKVVLFDRYTNKIIPSDAVTSIHLQAIDGQVLDYQRILIRKGVGSGYILVSPKASTGVHQLIAYTQEMQANADTASFFISPFIVPDKNEITIKARPAAAIEGGQPITNVTNRLIITGQPMAQVRININGTDSIFTLPETGLSAVNVRPASNKNLQVAIDNQSIPLPSSTDNGIALTASLSNESIDINIASQENSSLNTEPLYVLAVVENRLVFSKRIQLENQRRISISTNNIAERLIQIAVLTESGKVLADRVMMINASELLNLHVSGTAVTRSEMNISSNGTTDIENGTYSIGVVKSFDNTPEKASLFQKLIIEHFSPGDPTLVNRISSNAEFNTYLAQFRTEIPWDKILSGSFNVRKKVTPTLFEGKLLFKDNQPVPDSTLVVFYLNGHETTYSRFTRKGGNIAFPLFNDFSDDQVFYRAIQQSKPLEKIKFIQRDTSFCKVPFTFVIKKETTKSTYGDFAFMKAAAQRSYSFYTNNKRKSNDQEDIAGDWEPDITVDLTKLKTFPTMVETLKEVVPTVQVKPRADYTSVRIFLKDASSFAANDPLYIIDGKMTDNTQFFLNLPTQSVSKIKVLRSRDKLKSLGILGKNGVIIIETIGNLYKSEVTTSSEINVTGIRPNVTFNNAPVHTSDRHANPDLRNVLYWSPGVTLESIREMKILNSDLTGNFIVELEGLTAGGRFVKGMATYEVHPSQK